MMIGGEKMEITNIITIATIFVSWILGVAAKKCNWINNNLIPIQNILIGLIVACIEWAITKDFKVAIALSGILAGGTYDIFHNIEKMRKGE